MEDSKKAYLVAYCKAMRELETLKKNKDASDGAKSWKYTPLAQMKRKLSKSFNDNGLIIRLNHSFRLAKGAEERGIKIQDKLPKNFTGIEAEMPAEYVRFFIDVQITIIHEEGYSETEEFSYPYTRSKLMSNSWHDRCSFVSYFERKAVYSFFFIDGDDDDDMVENSGEEPKDTDPAPPPPNNNNNSKSFPVSANQKSRLVSIEKQIHARKLGGEKAYQDFLKDKDKLDYKLASQHMTNLIKLLNDYKYEGGF